MVLSFSGFGNLEHFDKKSYFYSDPVDAEQGSGVARRMTEVSYTQPLDVTTVKDDFALSAMVEDIVTRS